MQVAKKLPHLPRGVDPNNPRVIACVRRIAAEAGELCAMDTIGAAKKEVTPKLSRSKLVASYGSLLAFHASPGHVFLSGLLKARLRTLLRTSGRSRLIAHSDSSVVLGVACIESPQPMCYGF